MTSFFLFETWLLFFFKGGDLVMKVIYKGLACLAALVLLVGQAEAAPQVASTLLESTDYEAFTVSSSDIGDTSNGATTVLDRRFPPWRQRP